MKRHVNDWKTDVDIFLESKKAEFHLIGYKDVCKTEIWNCLHTFVWKENDYKQLHEIVQDILQLNHESYMNYLQLVAMKSDKTNMMDSIQSVLGTDSK